ncbi:MAG: hypothetical protein NWR72_20775 [Bacteroidia bacterium]|nr:hypothetical protein [Bacteroidia bacterium]
MTMSRYEDLCQIYTDHQRSMKTYKESAVGFAERLIAAITEDFGLSPDKISYRDEQDRRFNGHPRAYIRLNQDSYFHLRFGIKLEEGPRSFPKEDFIQDVRFKKMTPEGSEWLLEFPQGLRFTLPEESQPDDFRQVNDSLYKLIGNFYRYYLRSFLSPEPNITPIGFKTESLGEE